MAITAIKKTLESFVQKMEAYKAKLYMLFLCPMALYIVLFGWDFKVLAVLSLLPMLHTVVDLLSSRTSNGKSKSKNKKKCIGKDSTLGEWMKSLKREYVSGLWKRGKKVEEKVEYRMSLSGKVWKVKRAPKEKVLKVIKEVVKKDEKDVKEKVEGQVEKLLPIV
jgi:hypothetical protein